MGISLQEIKESFLRHVNRSFMWRLIEIDLTSQEFDLMVKTGIQSDRLHKYLVWRKSTLLSTSLFVIITAIVSLVGLKDVDWQALNGFGKLAFTMEYMSPAIGAISVVLSLIWWSKKPHLSFAILSIGWIISLFMPLWPAIFPVEYYVVGGTDVDLEYFDDADDFAVAYYTLYNFSIRAYYAADYGIKIFPVVATVPSGMIRGALRIRGLLPESTLAGWLIVIAAPFYPLIVLLAVVLISQLFGDFLLVVGSTVLLIAPTLYIFRRELYTSPTLTEEQMRSLNCNQKLGMGLTTLGVILLAAWILRTGAVNLKTIDIFQFFTSFIGRLLSTTVVFADLSLRMTISNSSMERELRGTMGAELDEIQILLEEGYELSKTMVANDNEEGAPMNRQEDDIDVEQSLPVKYYSSGIDETDKMELDSSTIEVMAEPAMQANMANSTSKKKPKKKNKKKNKKREEPKTVVDHGYAEESESEYEEDSF